jgi:tRNA dimethylallyltransferase
MAESQPSNPPSSLLRRERYFIAGPTAVGKTALALALAERLNGEIISVDSMQVYRGLDIGTAKPTPEERVRVQHYLIDVVDLAEPFDAAKFVKLASEAEQQIRNRNRIPIFCGGTGLYFKGYLQGLGEAPASDELLRAELEKMPLSDLLTELQSRDPDTFARIDRNNPRRVVRAVEVIRLTGKPFSEQRAQWQGDSSEITEPVLLLSRDRNDVVHRINQRVDAMFRAGLVAETERLLQRGLIENRTAMQAIGYRQVVEHLRGERSLNETIELIKVKTRQFARRQMTWFRHQFQVREVLLTANDTPASVLDRLLV